MKPTRKAAVFSMLLGLALVISTCAAYAAPKIYVDVSGIENRLDLDSTEKYEVMMAMFDTLKKNLEEAFGVGNVILTIDPKEKGSADRTVTTVSGIGMTFDKDLNMILIWGKSSARSSNVSVYAGSCMDTPPAPPGVFKKDGGSWDTKKLGTAMGTTAAHEIAHTYSAGHDDTTKPNKMNTASKGSDLAGGLSFNAGPKKTLDSNKGKPPCATITNYSTVACLADWWSDPTFPQDYLLHEAFSITTSFVFGGQLAPMFDFGWWGIDTDNGAQDGKAWGDFVYKSSMTGGPGDNAQITFFDGWTAHFVLRGLPGTPSAGQYFDVQPADILLSNWVTRPDATSVARHINLSWNVNGISGPDVNVSLDTNVYGAGTPPYSGFNKGVAPPISIPKAKQHAEGSTVCVAGDVVTAAFQGYFYVEDTGRHSGIRVNWPTPVNPGATAYVIGKIQTNTNGERNIEAITVQSSGQSPLGPLGMVNGAVGGSDFDYIGCKWPSGQQGVIGGVGMNNIGLYVRVFGRVTQVDPSQAPAWFTIDDGSGIGLKVAYGPGPTLPDNHAYVTVSGISSCEMPLPAERPTRLVKATGWQPVPDPPEE